MESSWTVIHFQPHSSTLSNEAHLSAVYHAVFTAQSLREQFSFVPFPGMEVVVLPRAISRVPGPTSPPKRQANLGEKGVTEGIFTNNLYKAIE